MNRIAYIVIGVLAVLAIAVGAAIYQQQIGFNSQVSTEPQSVGQQVSEQIPTQNSTSSAEENLVKAAPPPTSNDEDRVAYKKKLEPFAKDTDLIEITNCTLSPLFVKTEDKMTLQIKNNDKVDHVITIGKDELKLPANGIITPKIGKFNNFIEITCVGGNQGILIQ